MNERSDTVRDGPAGNHLMKAIPLLLLSIKMLLFKNQ